MRDVLTGGTTLTRWLLAVLMLVLAIGPALMTRFRPLRGYLLKDQHDVDAYSVGFALGLAAAAGFRAFILGHVPEAWTGPLFLTVYFACLVAPSFIPGETCARIRERRNTIRGRSVYAVGFLLGSLAVALLEGASGMTWFVVAAGCGVLAWALLPRLASTFGQSVWLSEYRAWRRRGLGTEEAIFRTVNTLRYRAPFNVFSEAEVRAFALAMSECNEPERFIEPLMEYQLRGDEGMVRDIDRLRGFVAYINQKSP